MERIVEQLEISIHTSAREVTDFQIAGPQHIIISIHTSAREVTKYGKKAIYHLDDFNPHFRKGSDVQ